MPKTTIVTIADKRPDFIEFQLKSFELHMGGEFEFLVLNNAFDRNRSKTIEEECLRLGLREVKVRFEKKLSSAHGERAFRFGKYTSPNLACSYAMQWFWNNVLPNLKSRYLMFIDSDMFLINSLESSEILRDKGVAFIPQFRGVDLQIEYPWNGIFLADLSVGLPFQSMDWHPGSVDSIPCDVGGQNHFWLKAHSSPEQRVELVALTVFDLSRNLEGWRCHVAVNGNWNINLSYNLIQDAYQYDFLTFEGHVPDPSTLALPKRLFGNSWEITKIYNLIKGLVDLEDKYEFPKPAYFDLIGTHFAGEFEAVIFHYKSGSNYQTWATDRYNQKKTRVLERLISEEWGV